MRSTYPEKPTQVYYIDESNTGNIQSKISGRTFIGGIQNNLSWVAARGPRYERIASPPKFMNWAIPPEISLTPVGTGRDEHEGKLTINNAVLDLISRARGTKK